MAREIPALFSCYNGFMFKRVLVVCNKNSSKFAKAKSEVLDVLDRALPGYEVFEVNTRKNVDGNAADLAGKLRAGDRIVSAGGDGTAAICTNAIALSGLADEVTFCALPYGNFNDTAHSFGELTVERVIDPQVKSVRAYPLELRLDGRVRRVSLCYFTMGMFAESAEILNSKKDRQKLQKLGIFRLVFSVWTAFGWWRKNRKKAFLPDGFRLEGRSVKELAKATDYMAVNARYVAKIMRNRKELYAGPGFLSAIGRNSGFFAVCWFAMRSVLWQIPGRESERDLITFGEPARVEIQGDGESFWANDVREIEIVKSKNPIQVLSAR